MVLSLSRAAFVFRQSHHIVLDGLELAMLTRALNSRDLPAFAFHILELKMCASAPGKINASDKTSPRSFSGNQLGDDQGRNGS